MSPDDKLGAPLNPPVGWFFDKPAGWDPATNPDDPLVYVVTQGEDTGRFAAFVAPWGACVHGPGSGPGKCVSPPVDPTDYQYAHVGFTPGVGKTANIAMGLNHANRDWGWQQATDHYAHTGSRIARVRYHQDGDGIWAYGSLDPTATVWDALTLMASALSGDWRWVEELESMAMIASQVVNVPGFRPARKGKPTMRTSRPRLVVTASAVWTEPASTVESILASAYLTAVNVMNGPGGKFVKLGAGGGGAAKAGFEKLVKKTSEIVKGDYVEGLGQVTSTFTTSGGQVQLSFKNGSSLVHPASRPVTVSVPAGKPASMGSMPHPASILDMEPTSGPLGSNGGQWYKDSTGQRFLVKPAQSKDHAFNELAASIFYGKGGHPTDQTGVFEKDGKWYVVKKALQDDQGNLAKPVGPNPTAAVQAQARDAFHLDAIASSWDAFGLNGDNVLVDPETGQVTRIDVGGAFAYRAMGDTKPSWNAKGDWVEVDTLRTSPQGKAFYGQMTDEQVVSSLLKLKSFDVDGYVGELKQAGVPAAQADSIGAVLKHRIGMVDQKVDQLTPKVVKQGGLSVGSQIPGDGHMSLKPGDLFSSGESEWQVVNTYGNGKIQIVKTGGTGSGTGKTMTVDSSSAIGTTFQGNKPISSSLSTGLPAPSSPSVPAPAPVPTGGAGTAVGKVLPIGSHKYKVMSEPDADGNIKVANVKTGVISVKNLDNKVSAAHTVGSITGIAKPKPAAPAKFVAVNSEGKQIVPHPNSKLDDQGVPTSAWVKYGGGDITGSQFKIRSHVYQVMSDPGHDDLVTVQHIKSGKVSTKNLSEVGNKINVFKSSANSQIITQAKDAGVIGKAASAVTTPPIPTPAAPKPAAAPKVPKPPKPKKGSIAELKAQGVDDITGYTYAKGGQKFEVIKPHPYSNEYFYVKNITTGHQKAALIDHKVKLTGPTGEAPSGKALKPASHYEAMKQSVSIGAELQGNYATLGTPIIYNGQPGLVTYHAAAGMGVRLADGSTQVVDAHTVFKVKSGNEAEAVMDYLGVGPGDYVKLGEQVLKVTGANAAGTKMEVIDAADGSSVSLYLKHLSGVTRTTAPKPKAADAPNVQLSASQQAAKFGNQTLNGKGVAPKANAPGKSTAAKPHPYNGVSQGRHDNPEAALSFTDSEAKAVITSLGQGSVDSHNIDLPDGTVRSPQMTARSLLRTDNRLHDTLKSYGVPDSEMPRTIADKKKLIAWHQATRQAPATTSKRGLAQFSGKPPRTLTIADKHAMIDSDDMPDGAIRTALAGYKGSGYHDVNTNLRNGVHTDRSKRMDQAFERHGSTLQEDTYLYRGTSSYAMKEAIEQGGVGTIIIDHGYVSTSSGTTTPKSFAGQGAGAVRLRIRAPKGQRVVAGTDYEREFILPRSTSFKVTGEWTDPQGTKWVDVDVYESEFSEMDVSNPQNILATAFLTTIRGARL